MKGFFVSTLLLALGVASTLGGKGSKSSSVPINVQSSSPPGYSQPIVPSYVVGPAPPAARHDLYSYGQPIAAASSQTEYYQPMDQAYVAPAYGATAGAPTPVYARHQQGYYEPIPQSSGHHHHYPIKRGHGWGHDGGELGKLALLIPLILIPLLLCWPWFLYAASHHHHPIVYASPGWKRSSDGKAPTVKEAKDKKTQELTEKILPALKE